MTPIDKAVARLVAVFGEPRTADPDLYVEEFRKAMKGLDPRVLEVAVDQWMKKDTAFWPRPGELLAEASIASAKLFDRRAEHLPFEERQVDEAARARVAELVSRTLAGMGEAGQVTGEATKAQWERGHRAAFRAMQDASPNVRLHSPGLTKTSKRMMGERE